MHIKITALENEKRIETDKIYPEMPKCHAIKAQKARSNSGLDALKSHQLELKVPVKIIKIISCVHRKYVICCI